MNDIIPPSLPKKRSKDLNLKWIIIITISVIFTIVCSPLIIRVFFVQAYKIPAGSMRPTLLIGDRIFCDKSFNVEDVKRGDIIIFRLPEDRKLDFIKRVVALPGDSVEIKQKKLFINGDYIKEDYIMHTETFIKNDHVNFGPVVVPADSLFVLGDNRDNSYDSRYWGFVNYSDVKGKATFIYWSWDSVNSRIRSERIGMDIN